MLDKSSIWHSLTYPRSTQGKNCLRAFFPKTEWRSFIDSVKFMTNALKKKKGQAQLGSLLHILMTNVSRIAICLSSLLNWGVAREEAGQRGRALAGSAHMSSHFQSKTGERAIGVTTQPTFLLFPRNLTVSVLVPAF